MKTCNITVEPRGENVKSVVVRVVCSKNEQQNKKGMRLSRTCVRGMEGPSCEGHNWWN